jgi:hypothetical protein
MGVRWPPSPEQAYSQQIVPPRRLLAQRANPQTPAKTTSPAPHSSQQTPATFVPISSFHVTNGKLIVLFMFSLRRDMFWRASKAI